MREFIEKLISKLEEIYNRNDKAKKKAYEEQDWEHFDLFMHRNEGVYTSISTVHQLAKEYNNRYGNQHCERWCGMKAKEEADNSIDDLELLIKEVCIPLEQEWICDELHDWDIDGDDESWCSRNCGKTNSGKCPEMNCYKEWLKMKRKENNNGKL